MIALSIGDYILFSKSTNVNSAFSKLRTFLISSQYTLTEDLGTFQI